MKRRQILSIAAVGLGTTLTGCLGDDGDDGTDDDGNTGTGDPGNGSNDEDDATQTDDPEDWEEPFHDAIEALDANGADLESAREDDDISVDTDRVRSRVDDAESALDEVETETTTLDAEVAILREVGTYQREVADLIDLFEELESCLDTVEAYVDAERWDDANDHYDACHETLVDLREQFGRSQQAFVGIDVDALVEPDVEALDQATIPTSQAEFDVFVTMVDALGAFLEGILGLMHGFDAYENGRYDDAATQFGESKTPLHASAYAFDGLEDLPDVASDLLSDIIELECLTSATATASEYFELAALEAQRGDHETAEAYFTAGVDELERCE